MTYSIQLPQDVEKRLETLSILTGRKKSFYVKEAILEHLDDLEDIYLAEKRLEDLQVGRSQTIHLKDIMKRYDLEH